MISLPINKVNVKHEASVTQAFLEQACMLNLPQRLPRCWEPDGDLATERVRAKMKAVRQAPPYGVTLSEEGHDVLGFRDHRVLNLTV